MTFVTLLMCGKKISLINDDNTYILVVVDVLSKCAWVEPIHNKTSKSVATAFERILARCKGQHPVLFQTDKGKEFLGKEMQQVFKNNSINYRVVRNPDIKAAVVERFNRTLKGHYGDILLIQIHTDILIFYKKLLMLTNTYRYIQIHTDILIFYKKLLILGILVLKWSLLKLICTMLQKHTIT